MIAMTDADLAPDRLHGRRVVLVDDDESLLRVLTTGLELSGCVVTPFARFDEAKKHLVTAVPDILIADVRLGGSNGLHLVVMSKLKHPEIVAVVMTGYDDVVLKKDAEAVGAHYVVKPLVVADLVELIAPPDGHERNDG